jgi:glucose/arabinose dehydrogenase
MRRSFPPITLVHSARRQRYRPLLETLEDRLAPAVLLPGFQETPVATGLNGPTAMAIAPDGRLWVLEQAGHVQVFHPGSAAGFDAFDFPASAINSDGERGLLGIAFDPSYDIASPAPDFVYLYHTSTAGPNPHNRISRFTVNNANPDQPTLSSESVIFDLDALSSATNHNGGAIHFGPGGFLFVGVGDNANGANAQALDTVKGKILRIGADGSIPSDNPFFATTTGNNRAIWALGLRNPFTFTFQPGSNRMFINDVGQSTWEEIDEGAAGANYGWPTTEGDFDPAQFPGFTRPFYAYHHGSGTFEGDAITGGAFYNPPSANFPPEYAGDYFFADFVNSWINVIDTGDQTVRRFASDAANPVDLKVAADGSLWYLSRGNGAVMRIVFTGVAEPTPTFTTRINFQTANSQGFPGYLRDIGLPFGDRGNGLNYGWNIDNQLAARNRNAPNSPDERYDTFIRINPNIVWEIAVPNGRYGVRVVAGDPSAFNSVFGIDVEGVPAIRGRPSSATRWFDRTVTVTVSDGRLTITSAAGSQNNKIDFVEIGAPPFVQSRDALGLVAMEAEHFATRAPRGNRTWTFLTSPPGFSGPGVLQATPNAGATYSLAGAPRLTYRIRFVKTGIHYVWLRGFASDPGDDTVQIGLDGQPTAIITGLLPFYSWKSRTTTGVLAAINVTTLGIHTLNIWAREDGAIIDKIVVTKSSSYRPTGLGPAESGQ